MGDDIEDFIRQQKAKIAGERQNFDRRQVPDDRHNGYKENIPPRNETPEVPLVAKMAPSAEQEKRRKLREERNQEYNSLLNKKDSAPPSRGIYEPPKEYSLDVRYQKPRPKREGRQKPPPRAPSPEMDSVYRKEQQRGRESGRNGLDDKGGAVIPGIVDRNSAKQRKASERNREYNEFLERQKDKERHRFDNAKAGGTTTNHRSERPEDESRPVLSERPREPDRREREQRLDEKQRSERRPPKRDYDEPPRHARDDDDFDDRRGPPPRDGRYRDRYIEDPRDRYRDEPRDRYDDYDDERPMERFRGRLEDSYRDDRSRRPSSPPRDRPLPDEDDGMSLPIKDRSSAKRRAEEARNREYNEFLSKKGGRPRKGWGTPTYDEILDEKRKQERDYRRHDDPEVVYGRPLRASYSDGHLNKSFEEERIDQLDKEIEEKKVRFKTDLRKPQGRGILDDREWLDAYRAPRSSRYDPDQEFQEWRLNQPPTSQRDRNLGDNRQQVSTVRNVDAPRPAPSFNDRRQRVTSAPLNGVGGFPLGNDPPEVIARRKEQYRRELEQQMQEAAQNKRSPRGIRRDTQPSYNAPPVQSAPERERRPEPHQEREREREPRFLQNQPSLGPYNTPGDESYHYYGMVDPLSLGQGVSRPTGPGGPQHGVPPLFTNETRSRVTFEDSGETTRTTPRKGKYDSDMVSAAIPTVDDRDQQNEKRTKAAEYQRELERQMQEQKMKKMREKAERDAYERKLEEEIRNYNPFGRGGGGAPLKDTSGNIVADLRGQTGGGSNLGGSGPTLGGGGQIASTPRAVNKTPDPSYLTPRNADGEPTHARGGHGIFGAPKTEAEKDATDKYKDELRLQIEDRKRREDERRRLEREEEEREQRKIDEQQERMKAEYEAELQKQRAKDEEVRRRNEELKAAAENKRLDLDRQRQEEEDRRQEEIRRQQEAERLARDREQQARSPPIPTLNKQPANVSERSKTPQQTPKSPKRPPPSPRIPKASQHQQRGNSPPIPALRKDPDQESLPSSRREPQSILSTARSDRAGSAIILTELDKMRKQLQNERQRVESSLEKDKYTVEVFDPRLTRPMPISSQPPLVPTTIQHPISPRDVDVPGRNQKIDFDIFDAAIKNRVPAAVRRPHLAGDEVHPEVLDEFQRYKNKRTSSRQNFRNDFPDQPTSGFTLEAQQIALLREQENDLNKLRRKPFDDAYVDDLNLIPPMGDMGSKSQLQSDSAFIGYTGASHPFAYMDGLPVNPLDFDRSSSVGSRGPSARERRRQRDSPKPSGSRNQPDNVSLGSTLSLDPEKIRRKNEDRLKRLTDMAAKPIGQGDDVSLQDPDDIIDRFISKQRHNRPPSGTTLGDDEEAWLRPSK